MSLRAMLSCLALSVVEGLMAGVAFGQQNPAVHPR